jgi:hypothetical protein
MMTMTHRFALLVALLALPAAGLAHRLDEYLQATLVSIEPGGVRVQINLTPGVAVADQVLGLIDRDHDGLISTNEAAAYAELLKRDLSLRVDRRELELKLSASEFPAPGEFRSGWGIMEMEFFGKTSSLTAGAHKVMLENRHLPKASVYLFNAAQPKSGAVQIISQKRNDNQSVGEIEFSSSSPPSSSRAGRIVAPVVILAVAVLFGRRGRTKRAEPT